MLERCLELLQCPYCRKGPLRAAHEVWVKDEINGGLLMCDGCDKSYPIVEGIPSFVVESENAGAATKDAIPIASITSADARERVLQDSERIFRDQRAETYEAAIPALVSAVEVDCVVRGLHTSERDIVLDVGCGTGRSTKRLLGHCKEIIGVDFSLKSLLEYQRWMRDTGTDTRIHLIHGDATRLPLREAIANRAVSVQLIQHIPSASNRRQAIAEIARVLRIGGRFVFSGFHHSLLKRLRAPYLPNRESDVYDKEGVHCGVLYYYNFSKKDLADLLALDFQIVAMHGLVTPLLRRLPCKVVAAFERMISKTFIAFSLAHLIEVEAVRVNRAG